MYAAIHASFSGISGKSGLRPIVAIPTIGGPGTMCVAGGFFVFAGQVRHSVGVFFIGLGRTRVGSPTGVTRRARVTVIVGGSYGGICVHRGDFKRHLRSLRIRI
jgi:hypothetical protein